MTTVNKACEWNRYCAFVGPFHSERLIGWERTRPRLVGRCYECGRYVCSRCADRRPPEGIPDSASLDARELLCPLDGEPLGRGDAWIVLAPRGGRLRRYAVRPGTIALCEVWVDSGPAAGEENESPAVRETASPAAPESASPVPESASPAARESASPADALLWAAIEHHAAGRYAEAERSCRRLLEGQPRDPAPRLLLRDCCEKLGRFDDAWAVQRTLQDIDREELFRAIGKLAAIGKPGAVGDPGAATRHGLPGGGEVSATESLAEALLALISGRTVALPASPSGRPAAGVEGPQEVTAEGPEAASGLREPESPLGLPEPEPPCGRPLRPLVSDGEPAALAAVLDALPEAGWSLDQGLRFLRSCEEAAGIPLPGGWSAFGERVRPELLASPLSALMVVELRRLPALAEIGEFEQLLDRYTLETGGRAAGMAGLLGAGARLLRPPELLAGECFRTGRPEIAPEDFLSLLEPLLPERGRPELGRALPDYLEACRVFHFRSGAIGFSHPAFEECFLARGLFRALFRSDRPDFPLLGVRPLPQPVARWLARLVGRDPDAPASLGKWLALDRRRRSLFRGADVAIFLRNLALVRLSAPGDARGLDLTDCDFAALQLDGCDFRDARLAGASFRNAALRGADFRGAELAGATFAGADLSGARFDHPPRREGMP